MKTIEESKVLKRELGIKMENLILSFQSETGLTVTSIKLYQYVKRNESREITSTSLGVNIYIEL